MRSFTRTVRTMVVLVYVASAGAMAPVHGAGDSMAGYKTSAVVFWDSWQAPRS